MNLENLFLSRLKQDRQKVAIRVKNSNLYINSQDRMFLRRQSNKLGEIFSPIFVTKYPMYYQMDDCQGLTCRGGNFSPARYSFFTFSKDFMFYLPELSMVPVGTGMNSASSFPYWIATGFNSFIVRDFNSDVYLSVKGNKIGLAPFEEATEFEFVPQNKWPDNYNLWFGIKN